MSEQPEKPEAVKSLEAAHIFGAEAEKVINNRAYLFATTSIKGKIFDELANAPIMGDNESILELVRSLQSVNKIQEVLEQIMKEGTFAEENLLDRIKNPNRYKKC
jgi:ethanolamine utilization cobalamin adenosyltransferase